MQKLSIEQILFKIREEEPFHAVVDDYSFTLKIDAYTHYVCAAIHDGHQFRKELWDNCLHSEYDRWYEEDPATKTMIHSHPIVIAGCDSRFEYDLNRPPQEAIFETAWGKQLWKTPLTENQKQKSLNKHANFYKVVYALMTKLEDKFGVCIVYDMHSYNWKRWEREVPTWNIGIKNVDNQRFGDCIEQWQKTLSEIQLPNGLKNSTKINDVFQGNGYFLKFITQNFQNTLVLATEISKIYCDEYLQLIYPEVVVAVEKELKMRLPQHATQFYEQFKY